MENNDTNNYKAYDKDVPMEEAEEEEEEEETPTSVDDEATRKYAQKAQQQRDRVQEQLTHDADNNSKASGFFAPPTGEAELNAPVVNPLHLTAEDWRELHDWVAWLRRTYRCETIIPSCWYRHEALVFEILGLRAWWRDVYESARPRATDGLLWHEHFSMWLVRIGDTRYTFGCGLAGRHKDVPRAVADNDDFNEWLNDAPTYGYKGLS